MKFFNRKSFLLFIGLFIAIFTITVCSIDEDMFRDKYPPTIKIISPTNNQVVGKNFALIIDIDEPLCDVYIKVDTNDYYWDGNYSGQYSTAVPIDEIGIHTLTVYAVDRANNKSKEVSVTINRQAIPEIEIKQPNPGIIINSNGITIQGTATIEGTNSIILIEYSLNSGGYTAVGNTSNFNFNVNGLIEGSNYITVRATGNNGKTNTSTPWLIIVDTIAPTLSITSHTNYQEVGETYTISGTASDSGSGVFKVHIYKNWTDYQFTSSANWSFTFTNVPYYENTNYIYAEDNAGNISSYYTNIVYRSPGDIVYASSTGNDGNDGFTPATAVQSIQLGIDVAKNNGMSEIRVEAGVYVQGAGLSNTDAGNNYAGVNIVNADNIKLLGGWNNSFTAQTGYSELDGSGGSVNYHVIWVQNTANLTIDGFVICGGSAVGTDPHDRGGGIQFNGVSHSLITNCIISNNNAGAGGGVFIVGGSYNTVSGTVSDNTSYGDCGGVYIHISSYNTVNANISGNTAVRYGGGMCVGPWCTNNIISGTISGNTSDTNGGGIYLTSSYNNTISGTISDNTAFSNGGGMFIHLSEYNTNTADVSYNSAENGGGICLDHSSNNTFNGSTLYNTAKYGGGFRLDYSFDNSFAGDCSYNYATNYGGGFDVRYGGNNTFTGTVMYNDAETRGGGVYVHSGAGNSFIGAISDNTSDINGGGVYLSYADNNTFLNNIDNNTANINGGGLYLNNSDNNTFSNNINDNTASNGGGVYMEQGMGNLFDGAISGNIAANDGGGLYNNGLYNTISANVSDNTAGSVGGGVCNIGSSNTFGGTISGNTASDGGGVYMWGPNANSNTISAIISGNTANDVGGGVCLWTANSNTISGTVSGNNATNDGGGVYIWGSTNNTFTATCVITNNICGTFHHGGGVYENSTSTNNTTNAATLITDNIGNGGFEDNWYKQ